MTTGHARLARDCEQPGGSGITRFMFGMAKPGQLAPVREIIPNDQ